MTDPFGREPERRPHRILRIALVPVRLIAPVAVAMAIATLVDVAELAVFPAAGLYGLLALLNAKLRDGGPPPGPAAYVEATAVKRALVMAGGAIYAGAVLAGAILFDQPWFAASLMAFIAGSEETRERLGLPPPETEDEEIASPFDESTSLDFHPSDHTPWERLGPPRAG